MFIWNVHLKYLSEMFIWNVHLECSSGIFILNVHFEEEEEKIYSKKKTRDIISKPSPIEREISTFAKLLGQDGLQPSNPTKALQIRNLSGELQSQIITINKHNYCAGPSEGKL